jgi:hypothetical protein
MISSRVRPPLAATAVKYQRTFPSSSTGSVAKLLFDLAEKAASFAEETEQRNVSDPASLRWSVIRACSA